MAKMEPQNLYEYQMLREEMVENLKTQNNLSVSTIGIAITVLTVTSGLEFPNPYLNLLPLFIVLPSALKTCDLKHSISIISSYLSLRYENMTDIYWETAYNRYRIKHHSHRSKVIVFLQNCEYGMLGLICIVFYVRDIINQVMSTNVNAGTSIPFIEILIGIASFIVTIWIFVITFDYQSMNASEINQDNNEWYNILSTNP